MMLNKFSPSSAVKRTWCYVLIIASFTLLLTACGNTTSGSGGATATTPPSQNATQPSGNGYGYGNGNKGTTPTASTGGDLIKTANATVKGASESVLTNAQGMTLYYRTSDNPPSVVCSGGCAGAWPPLVVAGTSAPTLSLPGKLTVVTDVNGNQIAYNGHLLYTFVSDKNPGDTTGEGVGGVWHVATPNLT